MNKEYVIIDKTAIQKRIEELKPKNIIQAHENSILKQILSQSTPLIPEIEKIYDIGYSSFHTERSYEECKEDYYNYISNLKLDI